jgi:hypothetical protein
MIVDGEDNQISRDTGIGSIKIGIPETGKLV